MSEREMKLDRMSMIGCPKESWDKLKNGGGSWEELRDVQGKTGQDEAVGSRKVKVT